MRPTRRARWVAEIAEARDLVRSRSRAANSAVIEDVAAAIARVRKAAALEAPELIAVAATARSLARLRSHTARARRGGAAAHVDSASRSPISATSITRSSRRSIPTAGSPITRPRRSGRCAARSPLIKAQLEKRMAAMVGEERFAPVPAGLVLHPARRALRPAGAP